MLLKVGQLARQICLSVRTLHHYDEIGLLSPSIRTQAGHRLYNTSDIQRLYAIQALKEFGLSLAQIAERLAQESPSLGQIIDQQIAQLEQDIAQAEQLKKRLTQLQQFSVHQIDTSTTSWLAALALVNIYAGQFTSDEIQALNLYAQEARHELDVDWPLMVKKLQVFVDEKLSPASDTAKEFVIQWTAMFERFVGHNPALLLKVHALSEQEFTLQLQRGITPAMINFIGEAMSAVHQDIYSKYLTGEQLTRINNNKVNNRHNWPPLIAAMRNQMESGASPSSSAVRPLAKQWQALFADSVTGGDPAIHAQLQIAYAQEPLLMQGTGIDQPLLSFVRTAIAALVQGEK